MQVSSVVDKIRSNSGAALKSVQRTVEETALKAAGLGDDEEALYMLNKQVQAYMRSLEAQQQAAIKVMECFAAAVEDLSLREVVRKHSEDTNSNGARLTETLGKNLLDPVKKAYEANKASERQKLLQSAFGGLIDCSFKANCSSSKSLEKILEAVKSANEHQQPSPVGGGVDNMQKRMSAPSIAGGYSAPTLPNRQRAATAVVAPETSKPSPTACDDLIGGMFESKPSTQASPTPVSSDSSDLLDLSFGDLGSSPPANQAHGVSQPREQQRSVDNAGGLPLDFDFTATAPVASPAAQVPASTNDLGSLGSMSWPTADDDDEGCVRARVEAWRQGKNIRTMLMSLHEIAPNNSGWKPIQWADIDADADIKDVYRKAVLRVHPDKVQGSAGKKLLAHLVFESLCEQWKVFRAS